MADDETKWHWSEGMKYALEGIKTLFILNGAAAISILTFIQFAVKPGRSGPGYKAADYER